MAGRAKVILIVVLGLLAVGLPQKYRDEFHPINEGGRVHAAMAIVDHGSVYLDDVWDDVYPNWREASTPPNDDASLSGGHYVLDKSPGVTLLALPVIALIRLVGAEPAFPDLIWFLALLFSALSAVLYVLFFRRWLEASFPEIGPVAFVAPALLVATPWLLFGSQLISHSLAATLVGCGVILALGRLSEGDPGGSHRRAGFSSGLVLGGAVLVEYMCAVVVIGAILALAVDRVRRVRLPWLVLGGLGPALVLLGWNALLFGDPLTTGYAHKASPMMAEFHGRGIFGFAAPDPDALFGLLLSAKRGLFFLAPWLLLGLIGAIGAIRNREISRAWRVMMLVGTAGVPVLLSGYAGWSGGQTIGPRYLVFSLPLFGAGAAVMLHRLSQMALGRYLQACVWGLVGSSMLIFMVFNLGIPTVAPEIGNPLMEVVLPVLVEGGPTGTIVDPIVGPVVGIGLMFVGVVGLAVIASTVRHARPPGTTQPDRRRRLGIAGVLIVISGVAHLTVVALPRTRGPNAKRIVLEARSFSHFYLGQERARAAVDAELDKLRYLEQLRNAPDDGG